MQPFVSKISVDQCTAKHIKRLISTGRMFQWTAELNYAPVQSTIAADVVGDNVYTFGGNLPFATESDMEVYKLNTLTMEWTTVSQGRRSSNTPSHRWGHTAVAHGDAIYIWGGINPMKTDDLYCYNTRTSTWCKIITETKPNNRYYHSACLYGNRMYILGGFDDVLNQISFEVLYLDLDTYCWHQVQTTGEPPLGIFDGFVAIVNHKMFMYTKSNLLYLDLKENRWVSVEREGFHTLTATSFAYRNKLYTFSCEACFGGRFHETVRCLDSETYELQEVRLIGRPPKTRWYHKCIVVGDRMIMFGGRILSEYGFEVISAAGTLVLDFMPSLQALAIQTAIENKIDTSCLPKPIQNIVECFVKPENSIGIVCL